MRLGQQISSFSWVDAPASIGSTFGRIARDSEDAGLHSLWVMDHFFQIEMNGPPEQEMLEGYLALAFAAAQTSTIRLGTPVTGVTYRHPGLLVKTVTTLDVLSSGRAMLGIGAAWNEQEHRGLGVPFPPLKERFERLEETVQIALQMWAGDESPYEGAHYQLERPINSPQSISRPHPPIMIGGSGEKKTLRMVAQYADACNIYDFGPQGVQAKYDVLAAHCERLGRSYDDISKTVISALPLTVGSAAAGSGSSRSMSVDQAVDKLGELARIGTDEVILSVPGNESPRMYPLLAEVVRQVEPL
ncbi:LLM class F420-dependent oxidoreductase [Dermatophilaceae bacterium Sec6.4]